MYRINQLASTGNNIKWAFDPKVGTIITEFQSGHGFTTSGADASSNVNDTTAGLPIFGSQCATVVSAGAGASAQLRKTGFTAFDSTPLQAMVVLKVDDITHLASLNFSFANDSGFVNEYHIAFANQGIVTSGQWVAVTLCLSDGVSQGSPTRSGITAIRVYHKDDNTGNKVTIHWGGIYFMPNAAKIPGNPFPNGVASICFDDGFSTQWATAKPLLDSLGYRASMFVIKDGVGSGSTRLTIAQIKSCQDQSGWEINAHAYTDADHATRLPNLTADQLLWDISSEKEWLLSNGLNGQGFAYPGGVLNQATIEAIRKYTKYARTTSGLTETYLPGDLYRIKSFSAISAYPGGLSPTSISQAGGKIDLAVANGSWLILTFHKVIPPVTSVVMSGNIATITFSGNHTFSNGSAITLAGFTPSGLNGNFTIASIPSSTTITVNIGSNPGNSTIQGTALTASTDCDYASYAAIINKLASAGIPVMTMGEVLNVSLPQESLAGAGDTAVADVAYTALTTDYIISYTSLTAARTVTLAPTASYQDGQLQIIKDEAGTAGTNNITVTPASGTIDGAANKVINSNYGVLRIYKKGSNFFSQ